MWSLEAMEVMNAEYVAMERRRLADEAIKADFPGIIEQLLSLMSTVPSLHHLLALVKCSTNIEDFRALVHEYLPELEHRIMGEEDDWRKVELFIEHFSRKYFPLYDGSGEYPFEELSYKIPVLPQGLDEEDYHDFTNTNKTRAMLSYLVEYPYSSNAGEGHREALYDFILREGLARKEDLDHVVKGGWTAEEIRTALAETHFHGMIAFAEWVTQSTGTWFLDINSEDDMEPAGWSRDAVENITEQWRHAYSIMEGITNLEKWLKKDPPGNFAKLVDTIRGKIRRRRPRAKPKTLMEIFKERHPEFAEKVEIR